MKSRWIWFLGGVACGLVVGVFALLVVALVTMRIDWSLSAPKFPEDSVTWYEREEADCLVREQVNDLDQKHGEVLSWFPDGRRRYAGRMYRGLEDGYWTFWGPEGQWSMCGGYVNGGFHGTWIFWEGLPMFDPPVVCAVATYDHGRRNGPTTAWRADGTLDPDATGWYRDDERVRDLEPHEVHLRPGE